MTAGAITMMIIGMVVIWGGLVASIINMMVRVKHPRVNK